MNKQIFYVILPLLAFFLFFSCHTSLTPIITPVTGFEAFPSARDFDPPGKIFRIDPSGVTHGVTTLKLHIQKGHEETLSIDTKTKWDLQSLFKTIGVAAETIPGEVSAEFGREFEVKLGSISGLREFVDDASIHKALTEYLKSMHFREDNEYYLIRETIATKEIKFTSKKDWLASFNAKADIEKIIRANSDDVLDGSKTFSLDKKFGGYLRVWFKAEKLVPKRVLGIGPSGSPGFELKEAPVGELKLNINNEPDSP